LTVAIMVTDAKPPSPSEAALRRDLAHCADISPSRERLDCYDHLAAPRPAAPSAGAVVPDVPADTGNWRTNVSVSPIDDSRTVVLSLEGERPIRGWLNKEVTPKLVIQCKEKKTYVYVETGMTDAGEGTPARFRLDRDQARSGRWLNSTDKEAVFFEGAAVPLIKQLASHKKMFFEIIPYNSSATDTDFILHGLAGALGPLKDACNWR
jgi:type VI secretion system protein VasI